MDVALYKIIIIIIISWITTTTATIILFLIGFFRPLIYDRILTIQSINYTLGIFFSSFLSLCFYAYSNVIYCDIFVSATITLANTNFFSRLILTTLFQMCVIFLSMHIPIVSNMALCQI